MPGMEMAGALRMSADLVRTRSIIHNIFVKQTDATHLLWADDDSVFTPRAVIGMIKAKVGVIGCPYPRKTDEEAPLVYYGDSSEIENDIAEVEGVGLGLCLISRAAAMQMTSACAAAGIWFKHEGQAIPAPYMIKIDDDHELRTEDYAMCRFWREVCQQKVYLYCGAGAPIGHAGSKVYTAGAERLREPCDD